MADFLAVNGAAIAVKKMGSTKDLARCSFPVVVLLLISCAVIKGQTSGSAETEIWPEGDLHVQFPSHLRVLAFTGLEQGVGYPFQQWYAAGALGYQLKPILREHWSNIDPDKEHYFVFGGGYEFLRTTDSGKLKHEDRITLDATPSVRPLSRLLLRDRNWVECRWINGVYSTTYRNMVSAEGDLMVHGVRLSPYGTFEVFYDGSKHSWDQEWYTGGIQLPYKHTFMLETYYRRENCSTCTPANWNAAGISLHFFVAKKE